MSLLDFGDDPVSPNPKPEEGGGGADVVDPFDPFGAPPSNEQSGGSQNLLDFDPFSGPQDTTITTTNKEDPFSSSSDPFGTDKNDPFGTDNNDPFSDNKSDPFAGDKSDPFASDPFKMDVSATEKQALEAQFDDLLGDFGGGGTTVVENGGTTTKTETVTVVENGETTTTTTTYTSQEFGGAEQAGPGIVPDNDNINSMSPQDQQDDSTLTLEFPTSGPLKPPQKQTNSQNTNKQSQNTAAAKTSGSKKLVLDFPTSGSFKPPKVVEESQGDVNNMGNQQSDGSQDKSPSKIPLPTTPALHMPSKRESQDPETPDSDPEMSESPQPTPKSPSKPPRGRPSKSGSTTPTNTTNPFIVETISQTHSTSTNPFDDVNFYTTGTDAMMEFPKSNFFKPPENTENTKTKTKTIVIEKAVVNDDKVMFYSPEGSGAMMEFPKSSHFRSPSPTIVTIKSSEKQKRDPSPTKTTTTKTLVINTKRPPDQSSPTPNRKSQASPSPNRKSQASPTPNKTQPSPSPNRKSQASPSQNRKSQSSPSPNRKSQVGSPKQNVKTLHIVPDDGMEMDYPKSNFFQPPSKMEMEIELAPKSMKTVTKTVHMYTESSQENSNAAPGSIKKGNTVHIVPTSPQNKADTETANKRKPIKEDDDLDDVMFPNIKTLMPGFEKGGEAKSPKSKSEPKQSMFGDPKRRKSDPFKSKSDQNKPKSEPSKSQNKQAKLTKQPKTESEPPISKPKSAATTSSPKPEAAKSKQSPRKSRPKSLEREDEDSRPVRGEDNLENVAFPNIKNLWPGLNNANQADAKSQPQRVPLRQAQKQVPDSPRQTQKQVPDSPSRRSWTDPVVSPTRTQPASPDPNDPSKQRPKSEPVELSSYPSGRPGDGSSPKSTYPPGQSRDGSNPDRAFPFEEGDRPIRGEDNLENVEFPNIKNLWPGLENPEMGDVKPTSGKTSQKPVPQRRQSLKKKPESDGPQSSGASNSSSKSQPGSPNKKKSVTKAPSKTVSEPSNRANAQSPSTVQLRSQSPSTVKRTTHGDNIYVPPMSYMKNKPGQRPDSSPMKINIRMDIDTKSKSNPNISNISVAPEFQEQRPGLLQWKPRVTLGTARDRVPKSQYMSTSVEDIIHQFSKEELQEVPGSLPSSRSSSLDRKGGTRTRTYSNDQILDGQKVDSRPTTRGRSRGSRGQSEEATTPQQTSDTEADYNSRSPGPRFEDTISDYQPPKRTYSKNEEPKGKSSAVYVVGGGSENMCKVCDKRVYEMEKTIADGIIYHKSCFKCSHCKRVLGLGNFASMDSKLFCKPHFIELFKTKGNYEEGFGMEKRSKQYARREQDSQNGDSASDVSSQGRTESETRELESKDLENGPSIGNIKSRFEGGSQSQSRPESTSSSSGRLNGAQEDDTNVHFTELNNVRNRFESAGRDASAPLPQSRKTPSKWDKPKEPPPPTVNRNEEEEPTLEDELPPQKTTQNLVAKFRSFESSQPQERGRPAEANQKSVRRMTPPRDVERETEVVVRTEQEVSRDPDIIRAGDEFVREDELPPPDTARNMRAMFQQMANDAPPPSPNRTPSFKSTNKKTEVKVRQPVREEPAPVSPAPRVNGSYEEDGEREEEETPESELPEQGFTRSLVAQWKTKETGAPPTPGTKKSSSTPQQKPRAYQERQQPVSPAPEPVRASQSEQYEMDPSGGVSENDPQRNPDVVREGDTNEEEFLPPPSYTKNLLAKFQSMEQEAAKEPVSHRPSRRKFKWEVKEVKTLRASSRSRERAPSDRDYSVTNVDYEEQQYQNGNHVMENSTDDELYTQEMAQQQHAESTEEDLEELPSHHYTKSMLAKFKSLEDVNRPPPTPEQSARLQKDAVKSASTTPRKFGSTSVVLQYGEPDGEPADERQQPDGGEYENYRHQEYEAEEYDEEYQSDAVKESDKFEDDLPEQGTTRNLLAKFQSMQS